MDQRNAPTIDGVDGGAGKSDEEDDELIDDDTEELTEEDDTEELDDDETEELIDDVDELTEDEIDEVTEDDIDELIVDDSEEDDEEMLEDSDEAVLLGCAGESPPDPPQPLNVKVAITKNNVAGNWDRILFNVKTFGKPNIKMRFIFFPIGYAEVNRDVVSNQPGTPVDDIR